ncbi:hypothetical protein CPB83DRAFT_868731 [Crepidotus variabilis]|uniref:Vacuolar sorting protein 39/Transforming growth factor beta receptor-associated domain-containing protein n=1 Tax=Crepidotus variabilis TaxID=179855 RepID=A0A9P6EKI1_9AGAR|nr:hypothetical protein CPB83DRAFT_868731 [Crepidotus variabilis]
MSRAPTFPRSSLLVLAANSIQSLVPSTLISQVDSLLESHRLENAYNLVDERRKKLEESLYLDEDEAEELRYVNQRIGFQCFRETLFEDAGKHLFNGELDPRVLISYFPDLRGVLFTPDTTMDVFAGVAEDMPKEVSVDEIIAFNLVRNYSPHLAPNTRSAPSTAELQKVLGMAAREMLVVFLKKSRARRSVAKGKVVGPTGDPLDIAIDTVLVKLYAEFEKTKDLYTLINGPNDVYLQEVETILQSNGQYNAYCILLKQQGNDLKLLEAWSHLVDGKWTDEDIKDPLANILNLLSEKRDKSLSQRWGIWMLKHNPDQGLKLLMPKDTGKRRERPEEDISLLKQIQEASPSAAAQFLEFLVLQRRSSSKELHSKLLNSIIDRVESFLQDDAVSKLWRAKASSYASTKNDISYLSYFASTTPDSEHKRLRLKMILLLAGSSLYDPEAAKRRLQTLKKVLGLEIAIVDGKLAQHRSALQILVHDINDPTSAEAYCALGGDLVPPKVAQSIAEQCGLQDWATSLFSLPTAKSGSTNGGTAPSLSRLKTVNSELKKELLKVLLEVYMDAEQPHRASNLVNAQAVNLDVLDVMSLVPSNWPLSMMTSFLSQSFRRTLHTEHEGKILKNISAGQNLEVKERAWQVLREEGAIIEEAAEDDDDTEDEAGPQSFDEKHSNLLADKIEVQTAAKDLVPDDETTFGLTQNAHDRGTNLDIDDLR